MAIRPDLVNLVMPLIEGGYFSNPIRVTTASPKALRKAVYSIACFFRREFEYDFVQYGYEGSENDLEHVAWLWIHPQTQGMSSDFSVPVIGACCFRKREVGYALQWVWLHPYWRRHGLLSEAWPEFISEFGSFDCEPPLSDAMKRFLTKHAQALGSFEPAC
jgi:hypothetical protein